ncbi:2'-5' RNA ligase family protein [Agrobacterium tumefaciens]|uniref:2'-5' RNA ligase family protein n=1 Tax=Agrobacterium tumefaciens TaxID=358 RepID=UPI0021D26ED4|nr:2'-5' RNA ligase family protein [Agrobacterium tumefaciens]
MKTRSPLIVTARIAESDLEPFDLLRKRHFPPDRNFLNAHLTMFYRLPGEHRDIILAALETITTEHDTMTADIIGVRHLGAGVAFSLESAPLAAARNELKSLFIQWLGSQDMQPWRPHITIQNRAPKAAADALYKDLRAGFCPRSIEIIGIDLWKYLDGPWELDAAFPFSGNVDTRI